MKLFLGFLSILLVAVMGMSSIVYGDSPVKITGKAAHPEGDMVWWYREPSIDGSQAIQEVTAGIAERLCKVMRSRSIYFPFYRRPDRQGL